MVIKREKSISDKKTILDQTEEKYPEKILEKMVKKELIIEKGKNILLSESGEKYAKTIIRRHRLAERLFKEGMTEDEKFEVIYHFYKTFLQFAAIGHPFHVSGNYPVPGVGFVQPEKIVGNRDC